MLRNRLAATGAALAALLAVATPTAAATPSHAGTTPPPIMASPNTLILSVSPGQQPQVITERVLLQCLPAGGDHPNATAACEQLATAGGNIAALNVSPHQPCILLYAPVTVTATGTWHGSLVRYQETFGNSCVLNAQKGAVFQF